MKGIKTIYDVGAHEKVIKQFMSSGILQRPLFQLQ